MKIVLKIILLIISLFIIIGLSTFIYFIKDFPRPEKFTEGNINQGTKIYDRTGEVLLYEIYGEEKRTIVEGDQISKHIKNAVISIEDKNFFNHSGLDYRAIARAILQDLKLGKPAQGASTITQQLIRSYFLTTKKTLKRKTQEIILAIELERRYSKDEIFNWYLNIVPFGFIYGVEEASQTFFGKSISDIEIEEGALLAAMIQSPSYYSPYGDNIEELLMRKDLVLKKMMERGFITDIELKEIKERKIEFKDRNIFIKAPHFIFMIKRYLEDKYGEEYLKRKGLRVITTLDWEMQKESEEILEQNIETLKGYNAHNGSVVGMDPKTGEILTLIGSKNYFGNSYPEECIPGKDCMFDPEVNTAITLRQPGSSFKPFVYAKAFIDGYTPNTKLWDVLTEFSLACNPNGLDERKICYHPQNYSGNYRGLISLKTSLAQSRNITSVKVLYLVGLKNFLGFIKSFGITSLSNEVDYGLSLVLGGGEVNLIEMVEGYSVFANDGIKTSPYFIKKIEGADGQIIERTNNKTIRVIPSYVAREINDILSDNEARSPVFGPNSMLNITEFDAAAKTGTTQNYKDGWLIGYTPSIIFGVWVGNNDNTPMIKAPAVLLAGPIWNSLIRRFNRGGEFISPQKRTTGNVALDGNIGSHSILYYIDSNNSQLDHWEYNIRN